MTTDCKKIRIMKKVFIGEAAKLPTGNLVRFNIYKNLFFDNTQINPLFMILEERVRESKVSVKKTKTSLYKGKKPAIQI